MKKNILIASVHMEIGGIEKALIGLLKRIDYNKYNVDLMLLKTNGILMKDIPKNVNIITPYKTKTLEKVANSSNKICKVLYHLSINHFLAFLYKNNKKYDVAISFSGYYPFIDYYIKNVNATKKLIWVHTDLSTFDGKLIYKLRYYFTKDKYKYFDNIICVSDSIKEKFGEMFPKYKSKTKVLWNIVDSNNDNKNVPKLDGDYIVVSVGRLCEAKRFDKLIKAHKKLIDEGKSIKTYIVGDGEERDNLKRLIEEKKLKKTFILLGKHTAVKSIVKQADLFVLPSDYEGFGIVLIEALDAGVPFVGTNVSGIKDVANFIAPKKASMLVDNNVDAITNGIKEAMKGKIKKDFKFDLEKYNKKIISNLEELINK